MEVIKEALATYSPSDAAIAEMSDAYMHLTVDGIEDKDGLKVVHTARMAVKKHRVRVEKTRKLLKADALEYGRSVDAEAKRLVALMEPIELHLANEESKVATEKARIKREAEEAKQARIYKRMAAVSEVGGILMPAEAEGLSDEDFDAMLATATAEYAEKLRVVAEEKAERKAEAERQVAERALLDAERAEIDAERVRLDAEAAERDREANEAAERVAEAERIEEAKAEAKAEAEREAAAKVERERLEAIAAEAARLEAEAARSDREKLHCLAHDITLPEFLPAGMSPDVAAKAFRILARASAALLALVPE